MRFYTLAFTLPAISSVASASAWSFSGYQLPHYKGDLVIYRSGDKLTNNPCVDIIDNDNEMSSFKWHSGIDIGCSFKLFQFHKCKGEVLASSTGSWDVPAISDMNDNRASSLWVDCL